MKKDAADFRTPLKRARGLGAAHHGVSHWWLQRVTALTLIPLSLWFVSALITVMLSPNVVKIAPWFASAVNSGLLALMLAALFTHAKLGVQVVIEDYVKGPAAKYTLLLANSAFCYGCATLSILAVLKLHFLDVGAGV